ncbi:MAG TPA: protein-L-isoaspartate O-methyltransferase [Gammaproteobacteria bacterium]|nr:protein-L-isoaspartate O-methyltransferase [Gammaproteobacteria bacterium]
MLDEIEQAHFNMVEQQVKPTALNNERVLSALEKIKRTDFVPAQYQAVAYADTCLPIGYEQVILSPIIQSHLLQALQLMGHETVLEIGTGSGYLTALLATLALQVKTVEYTAELSAQAKKNCADYDLHNITFCVGDGSVDWPLEQPVDVIVLTASLTAMPMSYLKRLSDNGRLIALIGDGQLTQMQLWTRDKQQQWQSVSLLETVVPPMIVAQSPPQFEF